MNDSQRASRMIAALLSNLDAWVVELEMLADDLPTGNKKELLHLQRRMLQVQVLLRQIADDGSLTP